MAMYDFDSLMDEILRNRPEITREEVVSMVEDKKRTVGAGFLTDQGALFLIAGEMGVKLEQATVSDLTLNDLYVGANDITIVARVLALYPIAEYKRKEGDTGRYRRVVLFDKNNVTKLTVWDDSPDALKLDGIIIDTPVRVVNGYVRQGLDGKPVLNLGKKGKVELVKEEKVSSKLPSLSSLSKKLTNIGDMQNIVAVEGIVLSGSRSSTFTRNDGSSGSLTQFELGSGSENEKVRIVIWSLLDVEIKPGQEVTVTHLRVKKGMNGDRELHGDAGSAILFRGRDRLAAVRTYSKINQVTKNREKYSVEVMALSNPTVRDVHLKNGEVVQKAESTMGDDTGEIMVVGWRGQSEQVGKIDVGEKVRIINAISQTSRMGNLFLELDEESKVEKVSG
ncbi:MAG: hypothetical protein JRN59_02580 [Nitrososphaerota archaeon]|nr:hypothetical protein [Nitrososphaerota archaeon]